MLDVENESNVHNDIFPPKMEFKWTFIFGEVHQFIRRCIEHENCSNLETSILFYVRDS